MKMMPRVTVLLTLFLAVGGCNSLVGFDLEGGADGSVGETKTLVVTRTGDMRGTVTSDPAGIRCSPILDNCSHDFPRGSTVTLSATGAAGSIFTGWSRASCSGTGTCVLTLEIDTSIEAGFGDASDGHNFAFVTKSDYSATMFDPLSNADAICAAEAAAAGLPSGATYVAWLSTSTVDAKDRLGAARGWVRVDGSPIADTVADVTSGKLLYPVRLTADGERATNDGANHAVVVTGTLQTGTHASMTCADWTNGGGMVKVGNANGTGQNWTDWFDGDYCTQQMGFYCFGTNRMASLTITPTTGRLAFVTGGLWHPGGGIASADALCQMEATAAGRSGTFKALLATSTASAASRFDEGGAPWVRVDGIPLSKPGVSPFDEIEAPLNVYLDGRYSPGGGVFTGAPSPRQTASSRNCSDWTSSTTGVGSWGSVEDTFGWFSEFGPQTLPCTDQSALYCFEQ